MPMAAAIYARISLDTAGDAAGVARQVEDCEREAERRGWPVAEIYVDNDTSAYTGKARPAYRRMLDDLKAGTRDAVIVWHLDRLHRRPVELEEFANVCDAAQVKVATLHGDVDLGNGDGLLIARIMAAVAANESDAKSRRVKRKMQQAAEAGRPHGGSRPFGYEDDRTTLRPDEARVVRELATRFLAGESLTNLTDWLNDTGVPQARGGEQWRTTAVRRILYSARISGQREHNGEIIGPAVWPAIITPAETERIRVILDDPNRRTSRTPRRYVLAGMLRCGLCDAPLLSQPRLGERRYVCKRGPGLIGCGRITIYADPIEQLIVDAVLYRLDTPELAAALTGRQREDAATAEMVDQITADQAQLDELAAAYANRDISMPEWLTARKTIEARLTATRRRLARTSDTANLSAIVGEGERLRTQWADLDLTRQAAIVKTLLDHAVVEPATRPGGPFDPARVRPVWRL